MSAVTEVCMQEASLQPCWKSNRYKVPQGSWWTPSDAWEGAGSAGGPLSGILRRYSQTVKQTVKCFHSPQAGSEVKFNIQRWIIKECKRSSVLNVFTSDDSCISIGERLWSKLCPKLLRNEEEQGATKSGSLASKKLCLTPQRGKKTSWRRENCDGGRKHISVSLLLFFFPGVVCSSIWKQKCFVSLAILVLFHGTVG